MTPTRQAGRSLLQSRQEWDTRNRVLAESMSSLINRFTVGHRTDGSRGLDVGCQSGVVTDAVRARTPFAWTGVDPSISEPARSPAGLELLRASADELPFEAGTFDVVLFANVYEHVLPDRREASLNEMRRVLTPGGFVVGQIPNPYFPIESHSRLPFMGWLPLRAQKAYWRLAPVAWDHDFFVVTVSQLRSTAESVGYRTVFTSSFNYPVEVIPRALRTAASLLERPMRRMPWAWQFVLRRDS
jgi:SAM-dependent methyltransferase